MIHHVGLEVGHATAGAEVAFWALIGFVEVPAPAALASRSRWLESTAGAQVHLLLADVPVIPATGHVAVVPDDFDAAVAALRAAGHDATPRTEYWGAPRTQVVSPAGHRVELAAAPLPGR